MNIINQLLKILQKHYRELTIKIYPDETICIMVYDMEIPVVIDSDKNHCYLETEACDHQINTSMMKELYEIMKLIDENIDHIKVWLKGD